MFYDRFMDLCAKKGVSASFVVQKIGLNKSSATYWKNGSTPKGETLQKLADYFGVSVDYLLGNATERVIIHGRLKFVEVNDPESSHIRYNIEAADQEAFDYGLQILENAGVSVQAHTPQALVLAAMDRLNPDGQQKVVERAEELTEIPRYQATAATINAARSRGHTDTTPAETPPQRPQEGEE